MFPPSSGRTILCLLAGGRSRRFGGPKAHLRLAGEPVLSRHARRLAGVLPGRRALWLSLAPGQRPPPGAGGFERVVTDARRFAGPIEGMLATLNAARAEDRVVFLPVDMIAMGPGELTRLLLALSRSPQATGVVGRWVNGPWAGRVEPFPSAWRCGPALRLFNRGFAAGVRGPVRLAGWTGVMDMPLGGPGDALAWSGVNTREELRAVARRMGVEADLAAPEHAHD